MTATARADKPSSGKMTEVVSSDDETAVKDERKAVAAMPSKKHRSKKAGPATTTTWYWWLLLPLKLLGKLAWTVVSSPFVQGALAAIFLGVFVAACTTNLVSGLYDYLLSWRPSSLSKGFAVMQNVAKSSMPVMTTMYCATVGLGCVNQSIRKELEVGRTAHQVRRHAEAALDVFGSIIDIGEVNTLSHVHIWELATAVMHTSELQNRDRLGTELKKVGRLTRDVNDNVANLQSRGIGTLTWILHDFDRVEARLAKKTSGPETDQIVDSLMGRVDRTLMDLLENIEDAIRQANEASTITQLVNEDFATAYYTIRREVDQVPLWKRAVDSRSFRAKQLARDVEIAKESFTSLAQLVKRLESARRHLIQYRDNAGLFKAGLIGFHLGAEDYSAQEEIAAMSNVIQEVRDVVNSVKGQRKARREAFVRGIDATVDAP